MSTIKLGDCRGIVEAVNGACTCGGNGPGEGCPACEVFHAINDMEFDDRLAIVAELDRLRSSLAAPAAPPQELEEQHTRVVWVGATSEEDATEAVALATGEVVTDEDEPVPCEDGQEIYEVIITASRADKEGK